MKVIYIDCSAGLSGSALLGALVDLGVKQELLIKKIQSALTVPFQLNFKKINLNNTVATSTLLKLNARQETIPLVPMVNNLTAKINAGNKTKDRLKSLFDKFIQAQSKVSGSPVTDINIPKIDILKMAIIATGFFTALEQLEIERIIASPLPVEFHDSSQESHPILMELARGMTVKQYEGKSAQKTVLGVALLNCLADEYGPLPEIILSETGYGISSENQLKSTKVRIFYGRVKDWKNQAQQPETISVVETAIDDMNPEFFPFLIERLLAVGAVDAFICPIYMKKGRPAHLLTSLCNQSKIDDIIKIIFNESTTLGVRIRQDQRKVLNRHFFIVNTCYGEVNVKAGCLSKSDTALQYAPEFEDCKKLAKEHEVPIKEVYAAAMRAAHEYLQAHSPS